MAWQRGVPVARRGYGTDYKSLSALLDPLSELEWSHVRDVGASKVYDALRNWLCA